MREKSPIGTRTFMGEAYPFQSIMAVILTPPLAGESTARDSG